MVYKDYEFISSETDRELCEIITIYSLVDDLVESIMRSSTTNYTLYMSLITVLEYYLTNEEYRKLMEYISKDVTNNIQNRAERDNTTPQVS